jgi:hypothetical protein
VGDTATQWQDGPGGGTPITAAQLNRIDDWGVEAVADVPSYLASIPAHRYDQMRGAYGFTFGNGMGFASGIDAVINGTGQCHDVFIGASDLVYNGSIIDTLHAWPEYEAAQLASAYSVTRGGTGIVPLFDTLGGDTARVSITGTGWVNYGPFSGTTVSGDTVTFVADQSGIGVRVWVDDTSATNFTIQIGAGTAVAQTTGGTSSIKPFYVAGTINFGTAIKLTATGKLIPYFVEVVNPTGYQKHNVARSSSGATQGGSGSSLAGAVGSWQNSGTYTNIGPQTYPVLPSKRTVTDGVTNATTTVTSATAAFTAKDVGVPISGGSIPANAYISSVTNATTVVISAAATSSASGVALTIGQNPHRVTISLGANDLAPTTTQTPASTQAGVQAIAQLSQFAGADIRLVVPWHYGTITAATWEQYAGLLYQLADTLGCRLVDFRVRLGNYTTMQATKGVLGADGYHVTKGAQAQFARALAALDAA